jgi:hypothetical protein
VEKVAYLGLDAKLELKVKTSIRTLVMKNEVGEIVLILKLMHVVLGRDAVAKRSYLLLALIVRSAPTMIAHIV